MYMTGRLRSRMIYGDYPLHISMLLALKPQVQQLTCWHVVYKNMTYVRKRTLTHAFTQARPSYFARHAFTQARPSY